MGRREGGILRSVHLLGRSGSRLFGMRRDVRTKGSQVEAKQLVWARNGLVDLMLASPNRFLELLEDSKIILRAVVSGVRAGTRRVVPAVGMVCD
jgi:hypothetical protein